jgi:hypothetical protein
VDSKIAARSPRDRRAIAAATACDAHRDGVATIDSLGARRPGSSG